MHPHGKQQAARKHEGCGQQDAGLENNTQRALQGGGLLTGGLIRGQMIV